MKLGHKIAQIIMRNAVKKYLNLQDCKLDSIPPPNPNFDANPNANPNKSYLLYIHIPFCSTLCPYCSFNRFLFQEQKALHYFQALREEIKLIKNLGYEFSSIYVGGGTTLIMPEELLKTLDLAKNLFDIKEISCEADPSHLKKEILSPFIGIVDRLSVGVQSFNDEFLKKMGRFEKFGSGEEIAKRIERTLGILPILNIDLIFNFPNQTKELLARDLEIINNLKPNQVTLYPLMSSILVENAIDKTMGKINANNEQIFYNLILDSLNDNFIPLSSWAFGRKNDRIFDEYVVNNDEYIGVGSGSFSFLNGTLYANAFSLNDYINRISHNKSGVIKSRKYSKSAQLQYRLLVELFGGELNIKNFSQRYGINAKKALFKELAFLTLSGNIYKKDSSFYPTKSGKYLFMLMMKEFYMGMDRIRKEARMNLGEFG